MVRRTKYLTYDVKKYEENWLCLVAVIIHHLRPVVVAQCSRFQHHRTQVSIQELSFTEKAKNKRGPFYENVQK